MYKIICFHNPQESNGFLSNWYISSFSDENGIKYTSMEQYMMYNKAILFNDFKSAELILDNSNPARIKELGRLVCNFDNHKWDIKKYDIVRHGIELKFSQNKDLSEMLKSFGNDCIFAECAVYDRIWGIGLSMTDPKRFDMNKWRGSNLLGKAITEVSGNHYPSDKNKEVYKK